MKEIDDNLLTEFLEGKLDEPANREIENWYDTSEENRRRLEALYFVLFAGDRLRAAASVNTDQSFRSLQRRIELRRTKTRPQWRQIAARYAAILVAGVIVAGMYLYQNRPDDRICTVSAERSDCSVTLPDGSVIRLTRSSQLNYPASFDDGNRTVHLTGEAFFEVSKRNGAPFTVTTVHDAEVVVRGTKFNLKAYDDSSDVETVLVEGAVDFRAANHVVALHPGQKVSYNPTDNDLTLQTVNVEAEHGRAAAHVPPRRPGADRRGDRGFLRHRRRLPQRGAQKHSVHRNARLQHADRPYPRSADAFDEHPFQPQRRKNHHSQIIQS